LWFAVFSLLAPAFVVAVAVAFVCRIEVKIQKLKYPKMKVFRSKR
jgi:hypothetical protein